MKSPYHHDITGTLVNTTPDGKATVNVDVYDVLDAFPVTCPALQHLIKKALMQGGRGHKNIERDLRDIIWSAERALDLHVSRVGRMNLTMEKAPSAAIPVPAGSDIPPKAAPDGRDQGETFHPVDLADTDAGDDEDEVSEDEHYSRVVNILKVLCETYSLSRELGDVPAVQFFTRIGRREPQAWCLIDDTAHIISADGKGHGGVLYRHLLRYLNVSGLKIYVMPSHSGIMAGWRDGYCLKCVPVARSGHALTFVSHRLITCEVVSRAEYEDECLQSESDTDTDTDVSDFGRHFGINEDAMNGIRMIEGHIGSCLIDRRFDFRASRLPDHAVMATRLANKVQAWSVYNDKSVRLLTTKFDGGPTIKCSMEAFAYWAAKNGIQVWIRNSEMFNRALPLRATASPIPWLPGFEVETISRGGDIDICKTRPFSIAIIKKDTE